MIVQSCLLCARAVQRRLALCRDCEEELPWQPPGCRHCGITQAGNREFVGSLCSDCAASPPAFDSCHALFEYCSPVQELIGGFKYRARFAAGRVLGALLAQAVARHYEAREAGDLVPVPLHPGRLRQRGFNQSLLLAREVAGLCALRLDSSSCSRMHSSAAQRGLSAGERADNIRGAFAVQFSAERAVPRHMIIIDDVVTTTATANELATSLRYAGVRRIDVWALARVN